MHSYTCEGNFVAPSSASLSAGIHSGAAAAAGGLATLVTHPFDVVKVCSISENFYFYFYFRS